MSYIVHLQHHPRLFHPEPRSVLVYGVRDSELETLEDQTHIRIQGKVRLEPHPLDRPPGLSGGPGLGGQRVRVSVRSKSDAREGLQQPDKK